MNYPLWKPLLIVFVVVIAALLVYPPDQKLKPGLDLAGGTTLTYDARVPADADAQRSISDLIDVLAKRADPTGTRNLVWRQVAGNRIEVSMALASPHAKDLRAKYQAAKEELLQSNLAPGKLRSALRLEGDARERALDELAAGDDARRSELASLTGAHDAMTAAGQYRDTQQALAQARQELQGLPENASEDQKRAIQERTDALTSTLIEQTTAFREAKRTYEEMESKLLKSNVDAAELERALSRPVKASRKGAITRADATKQLLDEHPGRAAHLRKVFDAYEAYDKLKGMLDDPNDLIAILRGSGVLEFRIAAVPGELPDQADYIAQLEERGPRAGVNRPWRWFPIDDVEQFAETLRDQRALEADPQGFFAQRGLLGAAFADQYFVLLANTADRAMTRDQKWELRRASRGFDSLGRNAVDFALDAPGGDLMGAITGPSVGKPMAILLDSKVISAPRLQSQIHGSGQITGSFSPREIDYLLRTIKAGSTEAELGEYPISIKTTGPQLGQDNLNRGIKAAILALILTAAFVATYYFIPGIAAVVALLVNMTVIMGIMAMFGATFTLPGIAGIVLTIGMAVDANVLIFERIREEILRKADLQTAIRLGHEKALSAIVDSNITTFITCVVLFYTATADIKGFAITLMVGLVSTLFAALFVSRTLLELYVAIVKPRALSMLPLAVPAIHRLFEPNVNWMSKKWAFLLISGTLSVAGITMVVLRGSDMLDVEFRSGTQVSFNLSGGQQLAISEVRARLARYGKLGAAVQRGQINEANLTPEELAAIPEVRRIVADTQAREQQRQQEAQLAQEQGKDVGGLPDPADFAVLADATVVTEGATEGTRASGFSVATLMQDPTAVSDVIKSAFRDVIDATRPVDYAGMSDDITATDAVYPVTSADLSDVLDRPDVSANVPDYVGGIAIVLRDLDPPSTTDDIRGRIRRMRNQPAYEVLGVRPFDVIGLDRAEETSGGPAEPQYRSVVVVVRDADFNYADNADAIREPDGLAASEWALVRDALQRDTSLASVSNFSSQVSQTMKEQAIAALLLSVGAIIVYIWFRFGSFRYSFGAILALVHDVTVTVGLLAISGWLYDNAIGQNLLLDNFKINLAIIAALLTIIGYSLNDTIIVFDRIRENRGRLSYATPQIINDSINQTISRTVITGSTTVFALIVLYIVGGPGVHGFAFAMLIGILIGTYSSIAIASPAVEIAAWFARRRDARGTIHAATPHASPDRAAQRA